MDCIVCRRLEAEVIRLERLHAEKLGIMRASFSVHGEIYSRLRIAESDARLDLDLARLELIQHQRSHLKAS